MTVPTKTWSTFWPQLLNMREPPMGRFSYMIELFIDHIYLKTKVAQRSLL